MLACSSVDVFVSFKDEKLNITPSLEYSRATVSEYGNKKSSDLGSDQGKKTVSIPKLAQNETEEIRKRAAPESNEHSLPPCPPLEEMPDDSKTQSEDQAQSNATTQGVTIDYTTGKTKVGTSSGLKSITTSQPCINTTVAASSSRIATRTPDLECEANPECRKTRKPGRPSTKKPTEQTCINCTTPKSVPTPKPSTLQCIDTLNFYKHNSVRVTP